MDDPFNLLQPILNVISNENGNGNGIESCIFMTNTLKLTFECKAHALKEEYLKEHVSWLHFIEMNDYPSCKPLSHYKNFRKSIDDLFFWLSGGKIGDDEWKRAKLIFPFLSKLFVKYFCNIIYRNLFTFCYVFCIE